MDITHITSLLGGIALFLYGMSIMGAGLEKLAGGKMQGVLQKLTSSTIKGYAYSAVRRFPTCIRPVGLGAKRVLIFVTFSSSMNETVPFPRDGLSFFVC